MINYDTCKITEHPGLYIKKIPNGLKMRRWICGWFYIYIHKSKNTSCQFGLSPPSNLLHQLFTIFIFYFIYIYNTSCQFGLSPPSNLLHQLFTIFIFYFIYIYNTNLFFIFYFIPGYIYIYIPKNFFFEYYYIFFLKKYLFNLGKSKCIQI
jgi:hypothetical protein